MISFLSKFGKKQSKFNLIKILKASIIKKRVKIKISIINQFFNFWVPEEISQWNRKIFSVTTQVRIIISSYNLTPIWHTNKTYHNYFIDLAFNELLERARKIR